MLKIVIKLIVITFSKVFTTFIPRDENVWVIGSWFGKRYADNSRYFYEHLNDNKEKYELKKIIWVSDDENIIDFIRNSGRMAYRKKSLIGCYYHLRAKFFFYDQNAKDINYNFTRGAFRINLWHGIPLKKIGYHYKKKSTKNLLQEINNKFTTQKNLNFILETSKFSGQLLSTAFELKTIQGPYPRNEYLIGNIASSLSEAEKSYLSLINKSNKKVIFYLPTFRDKCALKFLGTSDIKKQLKIISELDRLGYMLVTKVHFARSNDLNHLSNENLINLPPDIDIYPFLKCTEILITDYSSVYFDFLYLDREIIFLAYDLQYYLNEDRGVILDYQKYTPGEKVYNIDGLIDVIDKIHNKKIDFKEQRSLIKALVFNDNSLDDFVTTLKNLV